MFSENVNEIAWFGLAMLGLWFLGRLVLAVREVVNRLERLNEIERKRAEAEEERPV